jgi:hypothetical protein
MHTTNCNQYSLPDKEETRDTCTHLSPFFTKKEVINVYSKKYSYSQSFTAGPDLQ